MLAVRSSEVGARTAGISPTRAKILVFALSAIVLAIGVLRSRRQNAAA